jgi:hypothetical protein
VADDLPSSPQPSSIWKGSRFPGCHPVLCAAPIPDGGGGGGFQPEHLLEQTGKMLARAAKLPLGATWRKLAGWRRQ